MTTVEFLVEEASAEEAIRHIAPKIVERPARFFVRNLRSKYKLLQVLDNRLRGYADRIAAGEDLRIVVLVDRDADDCISLKRRLEAAANAAQLLTRTRSAGRHQYRVLNRIVVEELESWFLGDAIALRRAFPKLPKINQNSGPFRNPDNGGTWETLHRFLRRNGIYKSSYPKIEAAKKIAPYLDLESNRSASFQCFRTGLVDLLG